MAPSTSALPRGTATGTSDHARLIRHRRWRGSLIALAIFGVMAAVFAVLIGAAPPATGTPVKLGPLVALARMSAIQAGLSTLLSLITGVGVAWALNRLDFAGRNMVASLLAAAIVTPGLVVALGLIAVWGRAGWLNSAANALFGQALVPSIFGLGGILFAHTVLNGAFAARVLLARLDAVPPARLKMARSLGLPARSRFALVDWPAMAPSLPGLAAIIFLLTFTSFPIVLLLGGGPANQTFEVAIYSAVRLDFDLTRAAILAAVQLAICAVIALPAALFAPPPVTAGRIARWPWPETGVARLLAIAILALAIAAFGLPLLAVLVDGLSPDALGLLNRPAFWRAATTSLTIATLSAILATLMALALALARSQIRHPLARSGISLSVLAYLAMPAVVLSLGFFLTVRMSGLPLAGAAPIVLVLANTLMALPFAFATLAPAVAAFESRYGKLSQALDLGPRHRFFKAEWPLLRPDLALTAALAFCLSFGDLGAIALFGTSDFATLPYMMLRAMGAYRTGEAASLAAILLVVSFGVFATALTLTGKVRHAHT